MNWMRSFFKVFHTSRCVFSVLLFAQELRNEERHSRLFGREEVEEPGFRWISNRVVGEESYLGTLMPTFFRFFFFFFRDIGRCTRFFRSHYVTWNTMATCRMSNILSETIHILFFLFFFFSISQRVIRRICSVCRHRCTVGRRNLFSIWGGKKDRKMMSFSKDIKGIFWWNVILREWNVLLNFANFFFSYF